jgi:hypothetical protein
MGLETCLENPGRVRQVICFACQSKGCLFLNLQLLEYYGAPDTLTFNWEVPYICCPVGIGRLPPHAGPFQQISSNRGSPGQVAGAR